MKRRMVKIGGDNYEVMEEGDCFIETKLNRYSWREGKLKRFVPREKAGKDGKPVLIDWGLDRYTARDIEEVSGPEYDLGRGHECLIRFAGVERAEKFPAPKIESVRQDGITKEVVERAFQIHARRGNRKRGPLGRKSAVDKPRWEAAMKKIHKLVFGGMTHEAAAGFVKTAMKLDGVEVGTIKRRYADWLKEKLRLKKA